MLNIRVDSVVSSMVRQLFDSNGQDLSNQALHFHFDCRLAYYHKNKHNGVDTYSASRCLHLLYHRVMNHGTYLSVFSGVTDSPFDRVGSVREWKHETTHDSCWRDVQVFSKVYFDMAEEINTSLNLNGLKEVAPNDMNQNVSSGSFDKLFEWIPVKVCTDPSDKNRYRRLVQLTRSE